MSPAVLTLLICAGAALLEGSIAGPGVRVRFAQLRLPSYSPSLTIWFVIGGVYYVICYAVLYRLLAVGLPSSRHQTAFILAVILMVVNAGWGFLFFRRKALRASFLAFFPYGVLALVLTGVLATIDATSAFLLVPYVAYLGYSTWWAYRLWQLNPDAAATGRTSA